MNVGNDTTRGNGDTAEKLVQFLIVANSELNVAGNDTGLLVVTSGVAGEFQHLGGKIFHDRCHVDGGAGANAISIPTLAKETVDTTDGELKAGLARASLRSFLGSHS